VLRIKRVYDAPSLSDGFRILVDRLWPRGLTKEKAKVDLWLKDVAPSNELRQWFAHDDTKWAEFRKKYFSELAEKRDLVDIIVRKMKEGNVTLLFGARDEEHNDAVVLKVYLARSK